MFSSRIWENSLGFLCSECSEFFYFLLATKCKALLTSFKKSDTYVSVSFFCLNASPKFSSAIVNSRDQEKELWGPLDYGISSKWSTHSSCFFRVFSDIFVFLQVNGECIRWMKVTALMRVQGSGVTCASQVKQCRMIQSNGEEAVFPFVKVSRKGNNPF